MEFICITSPEDYRFKDILSSYSSSFPENERRDDEQFKRLFAHPNVKVSSIFHDNENIGYLVIWELSHFTFVEHFEVFERFRNKKYGSQVTEHLFKEHKKIVLEIEPESLDEMAKRRYHFYQRNGFSIIDENYVQPSYGEGKAPLNLWLMANYPSDNIQNIKEELYDIVYR